MSEPREAPEILLQLLADPDIVIRTDEMTWTAVAREAMRQGVLPLLHARGRRLPEGTVPAAVAAAVRDSSTRMALWSAVILRELDLIAGTLAARDIPVLLLKGIHLAADVYDAPALRTMGDIDIMVPRDQLADAWQALTDAGFQGDAVTDLDEYCRTNNHLPRMAPPAGRGVGLEVHWTIELPTSPFDIRHAELWADARPLRVNDRDVLVLSPEHLILHLCLHACYHHRFDHTPLKQLCDIAVALRRYHGDIDWDVLVGTAERWRVQTFIRFTLLLTRELFGSELPDAIHSLPADAEEARLLGNARAYILNCTMTMPAAFTKVVRARSWRRSVRAAFVHLFPRPARIAAIYGLPRHSRRVPLWYLLRPFDLLLRRGRTTLELVLPGRTRRRMRDTERHRALLKTSLRGWARAAGPPTS
ncbi:MAG TPA: nucleotidyltransferase family protein [Longimicrobiales bacterium]